MMSTHSLFFTLVAFVVYPVMGGHHCPKDVDIKAGMKIGKVRVGPEGKCTDFFSIRKGESVRFEADWINTEHRCPGCIEQLHIGLARQDDALDCLWSKKNAERTEEGTYAKLFGPFDTPGEYEIHALGQWWYECKDKKEGISLVTINVVERFCDEEADHENLTTFCPSWANAGFCIGNSTDWMMKYCSRSCCDKANEL